MLLTLRRAQGRHLGHWGPDDYDVLDGERGVRHIHRINAAHEPWWWGVSFMLTGCMFYGTAPTRGDAMAAFPAEYQRWQREG